jgi:hypothetical protein
MCMNETISRANPCVSSPGADACVADEAEQLVSGHRVLVAAQALDEFHRRDDGTGSDLILVAWHRASLPVR